MSELKPRPCPICGAELKIYGPEDWRPTFNDPDSGGEPYNAVCDCGFKYSNMSYDYTEFIACLNRRAQPVNEPPVRCGECVNYQTQNCAAKHEQALMDFCSHGIRKPGGEQDG